ncbi:MAG: AtpZ/AtpI family protein [Candidatus Pacebacteria bacterium]|nr:AtpZ/AtpI family protein [Candidatus Paceibacterota bacterium]MDR3583038.1 AtpZ/AtpI family protein [Candidatus Paceibacterota bacterium]
MEDKNPVREKSGKEEGGETRAPWWQPGLVLFTKLSGWIAVPVVIAVFLGGWLDKKFGTAPWLFLATVGAAFFLSMFGIVRDAMQEMKRIEKETENKKSKAQRRNVK